MKTWQNFLDENAPIGIPSDKFQYVVEELHKANANCVKLYKLIGDISAMDQNVLPLRQPINELNIQVGNVLKFLQNI